jgi:hypothetical protein
MAGKAAENMNELLNLAINAHGGLDRWDKITAIEATLSITGAIWHVKGKPDVLKDIIMTAETGTERVTTVFAGQDKRSIFTPGRIVIEKTNGTLLEARDDPEDSFAGQELNTPWDDIHVAYFSGEALWTYLNTPFACARDDFGTEEISPVEAGRETWRRLRVTFPDTVKSHTRKQIFCFGPDGLLRRQDYTVDILGGATGLNYASDYEAVDGIVFPMTRRIYPYQGDYQKVDEPLLVAVDITRIRLS